MCLMRLQSQLGKPPDRGEQSRKLRRRLRESKLRLDSVEHIDYRSCTLHVRSFENRDKTATSRRDTEFCQPYERRSFPHIRHRNSSTLEKCETASRQRTNSHISTPYTLYLCRACRGYSTRSLFIFPSRANNAPGVNKVQDVDHRGQGTPPRQLMKTSIRTDCIQIKEIEAEVRRSLVLSNGQILILLCRWPRLKRTKPPLSIWVNSRQNSRS